MRFTHNFFLIHRFYVYTASAQIKNNLLYCKNFVRHAEGTKGTQLSPQISIIAYLNSTHFKIAMENAKPWESGSNSDASYWPEYTSVIRYPFNIKNGNIISGPDWYPAADNTQKPVREI
jgi:hypothetical protein